MKPLTKEGFKMQCFSHSNSTYMHASLLMIHCSKFRATHSYNIQFFFCVFYGAVFHLTTIILIISLRTLSREFQTSLSSDILPWGILMKYTDKSQTAEDNRTTVCAKRRDGILISGLQRRHSPHQGCVLRWRPTISTEAKGSFGMLAIRKPKMLKEEHQ